MPFGLGFFATAGSGGAAGSYDLLESQVLGSSAASVTFSSLSSYASTYKHLQIRITARASRAASTTDPMIIKLNGSTQTRSHALYGNGSSLNSYSETTAYSLWDAITGASATSNAFGGIVIDLLDAFDTNKNKTLRAMTGANTVVTLGSVLYGTTSATTSLEFTAFSGTNFLTGSRFSLYGIKGA
jgi:hypothetical protein